MPYLDNELNPYPYTVATSAVANGAFRLVNNILLYFADGGAVGAVIAGYWKDCRVRAAAKATGEAWVVGATLWWDNTNSRFTTTASGNGNAVAFATAAAASGDTTRDVSLLGAVR